MRAIYNIGAVRQRKQLRTLTVTKKNKESFPKLLARQDDARVNKRPEDCMRVLKRSAVCVAINSILNTRWHKFQEPLGDLDSIRRIGTPTMIQWRGRESKRADNHASSSFSSH